HQIGQLVLPEIEEGDWVYLSEQEKQLAQNII
ncbi:16S rRNA pseudouridine(516) synthase, partial [Acinetobacter baumannii]